jgi:predicted phosphoribosyltransferase
LVLAVPVAPTSTLDDLRGEADDIVCLAIGAYARDFSQASDEEVIDILKQFSRRLTETKEPAA